MPKHRPSSPSSAPFAHDAPEPRVHVKDTPDGKVLFVDGSHASEWQPERAVTHSIWDLLAAPVMLLPAERVPRVLLMGIGGGTVLRVLRALRPDASLTGVELDADVVAAARSAFALDALGATIVVDDAQRFVAQTPARAAFDLIIDDVYQGQVGAMFKPEGWEVTLRRCFARLSAVGVLVCNVLTRREEPTLADVAAGRVGVKLCHRDYHNRILVLGKRREFEPRGVRAALASAELLAPVLRRSSVNACDFT